MVLIVTLSVPRSELPEEVVDVLPDFLDDVPDFSEYPAGPARKQAFFDYFLPIVQARNDELLALRRRVLELRAQGPDLAGAEERRMREIAAEFGLRDFDTTDENAWEMLLRRVDVVPASLALAQAANESAWGTSRFALEGNNYFGQWCFEPGCGLVPRSRDADKTHEVAVYGSPVESVERYVANLNRSSAYTPLREIREDLRAQGEPITGLELAAGLRRYSERGEDYIEELQSMIRFNKLTRFDAGEAPTTI